MTKEFLAFSDGTYTLSETEVENEFYFFRNDGGVLSDITDEPLDFYHTYIMKKMMDGEITDMVMKNIYSQMSTDNKCIKLTVYEYGESPLDVDNSTVIEKKPNFFKRMLNKIFG